MKQGSSTVKQGLLDKSHSSQLKKSADVIKEFADELVAATWNKVPVAPLRDRMEGMSLQDAYEVQDAQLKHHLVAGRVLAGRKVGLTSITKGDGTSDSSACRDCWFTA